MRLIRFAIVTDTVNFSEEAKKTTQDDKDIVNRIDLLLGLDTLSRTVDYQLVLAAKTDVSGFNNTQLLKKDLKVTVFAKRYQHSLIHLTSCCLILCLYSIHHT